MMSSTPYVCIACCSVIKPAAKTTHVRLQGFSQFYCILKTDKGFSCQTLHVHKGQEISHNIRVVLQSMELS